MSEPVHDTLAPPPWEAEAAGAEQAPAAAPERGTRLVLVRHGESVSNAAGVIAGHLSCTGLSDLGRRQAEALAARLRRTGELAGAAAIYTSILPRAHETAEIVAGGLGSPGLVPERTCDLCEQHPGEADGLMWDDYQARYGPYSARNDPQRPFSPGGESWAEVLSRVSTTLPEIARRHAGGIVLVVAHGGVIDASLVCFLGLADHGAGVSFRTWNASLTEWQHTGRRWALVRYNDTAHLGAGSAPPTR
jgi:probable phosphoglycerate mutase